MQGSFRMDLGPEIWGVISMLCHFTRAGSFLCLKSTKRLIVSLWCLVEILCLVSAGENGYFAGLTMWWF